MIKEYTPEGCQDLAETCSEKEVQALVDLHRAFQFIGFAGAGLVILSLAFCGSAKKQDQAPSVQPPPAVEAAPLKR